MTCSLDDYRDWFGKTYERDLYSSLIRDLVSVERSNKQLWQAMNFDSTRKDFLSGLHYPTNGQIMLSTGALCSQSLSNVKIGRAGMHGNFSDQEIYDTMCHNNCLISDSLREEAMNISRCTCLELSTPTNDPLFKIPGDWCRKSSGSKLCQVLGICGEWSCALNDFHCKRMEYNTIFVPLRGQGNDCSRGLSLTTHFGISMLIIALSALLGSR